MGKLKRKDWRYENKRLVKKPSNPGLSAAVYFFIRRFDMSSNFGAGILMIIDFKSGDVQTELTFREVSQMLGVSDKTIIKHIKSDKPIEGRFYVSYIPGVSKNKGNSRLYPKSWIDKFTKDWKAMQRIFGVEVAG